MDKPDLELLKLIRNYIPAITEIALQEEIAKVGKLMHFKAGEVIMDYGSYVKLVPLVIKGSIKVVREDAEGDNEVFLYFLNSGETCTMSFSCCMMKYLNQKSEIINSQNINTTHQQIALDMNASREAISRLLKQLEKAGQIKLGRNKIEVL